MAAGETGRYFRVLRVGRVPAGSGHRPWRYEFVPWESSRQTIPDPAAGISAAQRYVCAAARRHAFGFWFLAAYGQTRIIPFISL